jgi:Ca-activated chloride channel homolog
MKRSKTRRQSSLRLARAFAIVLVVAGAGSSFGQQPQPTPSPSGRTVNLPLIIVDKSNQSVDDVQKDELRVFENKTPQTVASFVKAERAVDYGIAIDNSGSFKSLLPVVLKAVELLVKNQRDDDACFIERFISSDKIEKVQDFTSDKTELLKPLTKLYIEDGQSAVIDAIYIAVQHIAERPRNAQRRRALVVFTDGEDRASYYTRDQLVKLLRAADVQLFIIGLVGELDTLSITRPSAQQKARDFLKLIARESGGRVFFPEKKNQISDALGEVFHDLHIQYDISYQSTDPSTENFHPVRIEIIESPSRKDVTAITRPGYYLKPPEIGEKEKQKEPKTKKP